MIVHCACYNLFTEFLLLYIYTGIASVWLKLVKPPKNSELSEKVVRDFYTAASSKAMSCHALLPLELRPAKAGSLCDHCRAGDSCPVTNRAGSTEIRSNPTRKGGGGERERKQSKTKRKKESRFNNRVIALFRITICQRFTKLYDTR